MNQPLSDLARRDSIRVLYVEDDTNCREAIAGELSDRGFVVRSFADAASLLDGLDIATGADIIVLDRGLPDVSGKCLACDRGAVYFIDKTRGVEILVLVLNPNMSRAYWNDSDMGLTKGEYKIVHLLVSNVGRYVTYRAIYDRLHYEGFIAGSGVHGLIRPWIA